MRNVFNKLLFAPDSQEKKKYLITSFSKLNFKSFKNFIFADEYLFRLYQNEDLKKFKYDFANSINSIENFRHNKNYFFKKITTYRKQLANHLNIFHNTNYSIKYWGIILDSFLLSLTSSLIKEINIIKNVKKKSRNIWTHDFSFFRFFFDTIEVEKFILFRSSLGTSFGPQVSESTSHFRKHVVK
jgi:hypothetical protein|tara:strand:- start:204 stop:758 length:555 start_codon:yes stop_codon:yes gene_type:complete